MKVCKRCKVINTNDVSHCVNCGGTEFVAPEEIACPNCGGINIHSFDYCIHCGHELPHGAAIQGQVSPVPPATDDNHVSVPADLQNALPHVYADLHDSTPPETAKCPTCGALVPIHAIYCQSCGTAVANLHQHRVVLRKICPHCGKPNAMDEALCSYCFYSLAKAETQEMQLVHDTRHISDDVLKQAYLEDSTGKKKICTSCGTLNNMNELFCISCGFKLDTDEQKKFCPNCGTENNVDNAFCVNCQWSFDGGLPNTMETWICPECGLVNDSSNTYCIVCGRKKTTKE